MFYNRYWRLFYALRRAWRRSRLVKFYDRCWLYCYLLRRWYATTDTGKRARIKRVMRDLDAMPHHWDDAAYARARQHIEDIKREPPRRFPPF